MSRPRTFDTGLFTFARALGAVALILAVLAIGGGIPRSAGAAIVNPEICDNCFDDDGNTFTDRKDPMCTPSADSGQPSSGLGDTSEGKAAVKCQKAIEKASTAFVTKKLGRLDKCVDRAFACAQLKNGDAACITKATASCAKQVAGIPADETKLEAAIEKGCDDSSGKGVSIADIRGVTGLGFSAEEPLCGLTIASASDLATCVKQRQERGAERVLAAAVPRAHEMLALLGVDAQFPDVTPFADGGGAGLASPAAAKVAVKCQAAIKKAGLKFGKIGFKATQKCADAAATCVQVKFDDASCFAKPSAKCLAAFTKLQSPEGPLRKVIAAVSKKCTSPDLSLADLGSTAGLGFAAPAVTARCAQFILTPSDPVTMAIECVGSQHLCEGAQMLERQVPRVREFGRDLGIPIVIGD